MAVAAEPILASTLWHLERAVRSDGVGNNVPALSQKLCTGHRSIDAALQGGLDYGSISCISAEPNSGASSITQALLVSHLLADPKATATVIDTTLSFDLRRLHGKLVHALQAHGEDEAKAMAVLERLKIMKVFDFVGLTESVAELRQSLEDAATAQQAAPRGTVGDSEDEEDDMLDAPTPPPASQPSGSAAARGLLVIDSISHGAAPIIKSDHVQGQALLTSFMRSLAHLTKMHCLCTIVMNGVTTYSQAKEESPSIFSSCALRPALGKTFAFLVDMHILVHAVPKTAADARMVYGGKHESGSGRDAEMVEIMEVLQDRSGGGVGRWATFTAEDGGGLAEVA